MQYKKMGRTGLKISPICMGTMFFGNFTNEDVATKIMDVAFENGINFFDTANVYAGGRSEEIVGKALKSKRHSVVLATKVAQSILTYTMHITLILPPRLRKQSGHLISWCNRGKCVTWLVPISLSGSSSKH